jgi:large subunit ribosomal protein L18
MKKSDSNYKRYQAKIRRKRSIRNKISGSAEMPRLVVYRSLTNIYGQIIDDEAVDKNGNVSGKTLLSVSNKTKELAIDTTKKRVEQSFEVGLSLGKKAIEKGITKVCFDRNGFLYHGRVKAFADGVRKAGVKL